MALVLDGSGSITGLSAGGLPDNSITANDIATGAITEGKIGTGAITETKIADGAISQAKLAAGAGSRSGAATITFSSGSPTATLTSASGQLQVIQGSAPGKIILPDATTMTKGEAYFTFYNACTFPVAIADNSGTTREYLPGGSASLNISRLELIDNSTASGVWRLSQPINAGSDGGTTAAFSGVWDTTKFNNNNFTYFTVVPVGSTTALAIYCSASNPKQVYGRALTLNPNTRTVTYGSIETLIWTNPAPYSDSYGSYNGYNSIVSNRIDRGIIAFQSYSGAYNSSYTYGGWCGFAIVGGEAYFSAVDQVQTNTAAGTSNNYSSANFNPTVFVADYNQAAFMTYYTGSASNSYATRVNPKHYVSCYKVNVSGTTVSLSAASGNVSYNTNADIYWYPASNPWSHSASLQSGYSIAYQNPINTAMSLYYSYDPTTNVLTSGQRNSPSSGVTGPDMDWRLLGNNANTRLWYNTTVWTVANAGTASTTFTSPTYGTTYKPVTSATYSSTAVGNAIPIDRSELGLSTLYKVSSSDVRVLGGSLFGKFDPSTTVLNINTANFTKTGTWFFMDQANVFSYTSSVYTFVPFADPYIA